MTLKDFLLSRDELSHPVTMNYRGGDVFPTKLGAALSIGIKILVLIYLVQDMTELVEMTSPTIESYTRPMYDEEIADFGAVNFKDYKFIAGIYLFTQSGTNNDREPLELPENLGRFLAITDHSREEGGSAETGRHELVPCSEEFTDIN